MIGVLRMRAEGELVVAGVRCCLCRIFYRVAEGSQIPQCCWQHHAGMILEHHRSTCLGDESTCRCAEQK